jgi:NAD(P)-dependent dehydrogenase (short-subunit alcohol dehydrogenase family)
MPASKVIQDRVALVTGANRGIGAAFVQGLLQAGAKKVYAALRNPSEAPADWRDEARIVAVALDVKDGAQITRVSHECPDVDLLINNAGVTAIGPISQFDETQVREIFEVNFFGPLRLTQAFAPQLTQKQGGLIYILSMAAMIPPGPAPVYSASKAACAMLAAGAVTELGAKGVAVTLSFPGYVDTRMAAVFKSRKTSASSIAKATLEAWAAGQSHVFPDDFSQLVLETMRSDGARLLTDSNDVRREIAAKYDALSANEPRS